ncbi:MAG TPA: hypothetical protein VIQ11_22875, partial [Mycobacterium sp.]
AFIESSRQVSAADQRFSAYDYPRSRRPNPEGLAGAPVGNSPRMPEAEEIVPDLRCAARALAGQSTRA